MLQHINRIRKDRGKLFVLDLDQAENRSALSWHSQRRAHPVRARGRHEFRRPSTVSQADQEVSP